MTEDDDLRSRLRRADPAASLAPVTPDEAAPLLEATRAGTGPPRTTTTDRQRRRTVLVAAALVLLAAAGAGWLLTRPTPPVTGAATPPAVVVNLTDAGNARLSCAEPTAQILATISDFAFAGTVTGIADGVVTLSITQVYRGAQADEVRVEQAGDEFEQLPGSGNGQYETGRRYLIASGKGLVNGCGFSGEADTPDLQKLYDDAF